VTSPPPEPFDWAACIREARAGSPDALGRLLEACRPLLTALAERELDADLWAKESPSDLVQRTFFDAHRDFSRLLGDTEAEVRAWLYRVLLHNIGDARARYRETAKRQVGREESLDRGAADRNVGLADKAASPSSNASHREEEVLVEGALVQLPDDYRQVILLRHREHLSFADAARVMNRSEEAIKSLWARAIKKLQIILRTKSR
jgi:RNA polymerase sigma-70 factor (ECF subfamily)